MLLFFCQIQDMEKMKALVLVLGISENIRYFRTKIYSTTLED